MAIDDILKAIEEEGQQTVADIKERAVAQADEIVAEASARAKTVTEQAVEREREKIAAEAAEIVNAARLRGRRIVSEAIERAIEGVFADLEERLRTAVADTKRQLLRSLLLEIAGAFPNSHRPVIGVSPADRALVEQLAKELGVVANFETDEELSGGLVARNDEETLVVDASLETVVEKLRNEFRSEVYKELFRDA